MSKRDIAENGVDIASEDYRGFEAGDETPALTTTTSSIDYEEGPNVLPIGFFDNGKFYKGFEIDQLSASSLKQVAKEQSAYKMFGILVSRGLKSIFDPKTGEQADWRDKTSRLFLQDVTFLMSEIMIKTKGNSLVPTVYQCPLCAKFTKFENPIGGSDVVDLKKGYDLLAPDLELSSLEMEDLRSLPFKEFKGDVPEISFQLAQGVTLEDVTYRNYVFRIPTIGDYIHRGGANKTLKDIESRVLLDCLLELDGIDGKDLEILKRRFGDKLLDLNLTEYGKITSRFDNIGYVLSGHETRCYACGYEYKTAFDMSNFFASVLNR